LGAGWAPGAPQAAPPSARGLTSPGSGCRPGGRPAWGDWPEERLPREGPLPASESAPGLDSRRPSEAPPAARNPRNPRNPRLSPLNPHWRWAAVQNAAAAGAVQRCRLQGSRAATAAAGLQSPPAPAAPPPAPAVPAPPQLHRCTQQPEEPEEGRRGDAVHPAPLLQGRAACRGGLRVLSTAGSGLRAVQCTVFWQGLAAGHCSRVALYYRFGFTHRSSEGQGAGEVQCSET
jgi:hypothetical protein